MKRIIKVILAAAIAIVAAAFIFLAPVIPTSLPREYVYGYYGACIGGPHSFDPVQVYVSISYSLIPAPNHVVVAGNWGLVYVPQGIPGMHNGSLIFFPPITVSKNPPPICA